MVFKLYGTLECFRAVRTVERFIAGVCEHVDFEISAVFQVQAADGTLD